MNRIALRHLLRTGFFAIALVAGVSAGTVWAGESEASTYPLDYCLITGEKLGSMGDAVVKVYDGREVKFCCGGCVKPFEKDQAKWMKKLDEAIISAEMAAYPLETCVVTGEKLGGMGDPVDYVYQNRLVRFCCSGCIAPFKKDPAKYLGLIDAALAAKKTEPVQK